MNKGSKGIKVAAFSDIHGNLPREIDPVDIILICGDNAPATNHSAPFQELWLNHTFVPWCKKQIDDKIAKDVIFIAGNHDLILQQMIEIDIERLFIESLPEHVHYLRDSMIELHGLKIYGTPWQPTFYDWAFNLDDNDNEEGLGKYFSKIPEGLDILMSHGPVYGHNDTVKYDLNKHLGSEVLLKYVQKVKPKWVYSGHIHSASHVPSKILHDDDLNSFTECVCVSILDEGYHVFYNVFYNTLK